VSHRRSLRRLARDALIRFLPARNRLPFDFWLARLRGTAEPELRHLHRFCPRQGLAVDVGAHHGHYSYRLSKLCPSVVAFEINGDLLVDLKSYNAANIRIISSGLSSSAADVTLFIPIVDDRALTGWASLRPHNLPGAHSHLTKRAHVTTLDSFDLDDVTFVKIDVEGHEMEVLKGSAQTLERCHPVLLVEVKGANSDAVTTFLATYGYTPRRLKELIGVEGSFENVIFLPDSSAREPWSTNR
jgi:FkbM family methyltransferase